MEYGAMTVNERLYVSGNLKKYDKALKEKDVLKLRKILKSVDLTDVSIDRILEMEGLGQQIQIDDSSAVSEKNRKSSVSNFFKRLFSKKQD